MNTTVLAEQLCALSAQLADEHKLTGRLRIGIDVVDVQSLALQLESDLGPKFAARLFTPTEIRDCRGEPRKFASRFALKEAVAKAIGTGFRDGLRPDMIEVVTAANGAVRVRPAPGCAWPDGSDQWAWAASATHEAGMAAAVAVAVCTSPVQGGEPNDR